MKLPFNSRAAQKNTETQPTTSAAILPLFGKATDVALKYTNRTPDGIVTSTVWKNALYAEGEKLSLDVIALAAHGKEYQRSQLVVRLDEPFDREKYQDGKLAMSIVALTINDKRADLKAPADLQPLVALMQDISSGEHGLRFNRNSIRYVPPKP